MLNTQIPHATTLSALRARIKSWRDERLTIGFVPTMGALHDGHLSLVRLARAHCDRVVASIFVNPAQFAPGEDFDAYPRGAIADAEKLAGAQCDLIYMPETALMYPDGFASEVVIGGVAEGLETASRPQFFRGVATVVAKLFNQVRPDVAVFGEKDYQQLLVIRKMVADLDFPVDIIAGETVREPDGLAMSSRNAYLAPADRERAAKLYSILQEFAAGIAAGTPVKEAQSVARQRAETTFDAVDYIEARCADTLQPLDDQRDGRRARILAAVRLGDTRLIDNCAVPPS